MTISCRRLTAAVLVALAVCVATPPVALAVVNAAARARSGAVEPAGEAHSLVQAAENAEGTGRKVAMSLIAVGFAIASIVLAFRRDFKEAAGVLAIGLLAVLLANKVGVDVLKKTVSALFGG